MTIKNSTITKGFILAGLINLTGVLVSSRFFSSTVIPEFDSAVMSNFGLLMIIVWGIAYIAVAKNFHQVKWLVGVFAIEKFIYGCVWINWLLKNNIADVFQKDKMAGMFYATYGVNDWIFFAFFLFVFVRLVSAKSND